MDTGADVESGSLTFQLEDGTTCEFLDDTDITETGDQGMIINCRDDYELEEGDVIQVIWSNDVGSNSAIVDSHEVQSNTDIAEECEGVDFDGDLTVDEVLVCPIGDDSEYKETELEIKEDGY